MGWHATFLSSSSSVHGRHCRAAHRLVTIVNWLEFIWFICTVMKLFPVSHTRSPPFPSLSLPLLFHCPIVCNSDWFIDDNVWWLIPVNVTVVLLFSFFSFFTFCSILKLYFAIESANIDFGERRGKSWANNLIAHSFICSYSKLIE